MSRQEQTTYLVIFKPFFNAILVILVCTGQCDQAIPPLVLHFADDTPRCRHEEELKRIIA